jgi:hypothetical protein
MKAKRAGAILLHLPIFSVKMPGGDLKRIKKWEKQ